MKINYFIMALLYIPTVLLAQPDVRLDEYAAGFTKPVDITHNGGNRLFIVEQAGRIKIIDASANVLAIPFLDMVSKVKSSGGEQGLLGLAFHPDYKNNGYFYVNYTGVGDSSHVSRYSVSVGDSNLANPASELRILTVAQPYTNHNGGCIKFGPDGYLYIGFGDGGSGGDPQNRAQDSTELLGKMLRIDVDNAQPYSVPASNPFVGNPGIHPEIWALGIRNPWRFSFDRQTGDLWIADVGQNVWEEIDRQPAASTGGENYGWRCYEAHMPYNTSGCLGMSNYVSPVHQYSNTGFSGDCSVTGGYVYRGKQFNGLKGMYFYADYCSAKIWSLKDSSGNWVNTFHGKFSPNQWSSFGEDADGELYVASLNSGKIFQIVDSNNITGIETVKKETGVCIYPNPAVDALKMEISNGDHIERVEVLSADGRLVMQTVGNNIQQVNVSDLKAGMYFILVTTNREKVRAKFLKE